jgi:hypothetical protein
MKEELQVIAKKKVAVNEFYQFTLIARQAGRADSMSYVVLQHNIFSLVTMERESSPDCFMHVSSRECGVRNRS